MAPTLLRGSKPPHLRLLKSSLETRLSAKGLRQRGMWGTPAFLPDTSDALRGNVPMGHRASLSCIHVGAWLPYGVSSKEPTLKCLSAERSVGQPRLAPSFEIFLFEHPSSQHGSSQVVPRLSRSIKIVYMASDRIHPVTETVLDPGDRQAITLVAT